MEKTIDTKHSILIIAEDLIQTRGYNAFSYQDISDKLKIQKASIHHHFHSKEDLGAEVLEGAKESFKDWSHSLPASLTPSQKLDVFLERTGQWAHQKERICLGGITSAEWNTLPPKMKKKVEELQTVRREWVMRVLEDGRKTGQFKTNHTVAEQALLIQSAAQGALQIARVQEKPVHYQTVMNQVKEMIKS